MKWPEYRRVITLPEYRLGSVCRSTGWGQACKIAILTFIGSHADSSLGLSELFPFKERVEDLDDLLALRRGEFLDLTEAPPKAIVASAATLLEFFYP